MTTHHMIELAVTVAVIYALWMGLLGLTYMLMDWFTDWHQGFKQARKEKAAKAAASLAKNGKE